MTITDLRVIAPVLTEHFTCMGCEQMFMHAGIGQQVHSVQAKQYPADFLERSSNLADWLFDLLGHFGERLNVHLIDPMSLQGFLLSLRYGVRSYPAFILEGHKVYTGWDRETLAEILRNRLPEHQVPGESK